jgi:peptidoglycan hydrolase-like protein with peptidoglycan-binding domain
MTHLPRPRTTDQGADTRATAKGLAGDRLTRRRAVTALAVAAVSTGGLLALTGTAPIALAGDPAAAAGTEATTTSGAEAEVATATATRGSLEASKEFRATIGYGEAFPLTTGAEGTVTFSHPIGTVVDFGDQLIRLDDRPVFLAEGTMPMYRELARQRKALTGDDVAQLQRFLADRGFDDNGRLETDGSFGSATERAVKAWQKEVGLEVTGRVDNRQIVFSPSPVRIDTLNRVGNGLNGLSVTGATPAITVDTSSRDLGWFSEGARLDLLGQNGTTVSMRVADQKQVTGEDGSRVWRTTLTAAGTASTASLTAGSATLTSTETKADDALLVPTSALLALAEGGFAVERVLGSGPGTELIGVNLIEVLDGRAAIEADVAEGDTVVVPS